MTTSVHDRVEDSNFVIAAFIERDRKLRLVVMTAGAVAVAFVIALAIASAQAGLAASREKALADLATARLDSMTGVFTQVEWSCQRALVADEKTLGPKHPDVARDLNSLAALYAAAGRYLEAEPLMLRALAIDGQHFGQSNLKVAGDLFGLAEVYTKLGRSADAEPLYKHAKEIYANLGSKYPGD